jgi:ParB/RepB/Spo0J family partition protein
VEEVSRIPSTQPLSVVSEEQDSGEWRGVLDRVKVAMANSEIVVLDPSCIRPMPGQPREFFSELSLTNLRESIRGVGQIQAGIVRAVEDGESGITHELLDGERRWRVVCSEGITFYRAQLVQIDDIAAPYMIAAIANFNREGHTPIEVSDAIHKLRTGPIKVPMPEIAKIFGFSELWAYQIHGLQKLHPKVREMLDPNQSRKEILPTTAAIHISKLDPELQVGLAEKVLTREVSIGRLRREVVRVGESHGKPVRTREDRPSKVNESFTARCGEASRNAKDMLEKVREMRDRGILPNPASPRGSLIVESLDSAIADLALVREVISK